MRLLFIPFVILFATLMNTGCKSSSGPKSFCDTVCLKDTVKFTSTYKLKPYVYISAKNCMADTLLWSYEGMGVNRKVGLTDFLNNAVKLNKDYIHCYINDTSYAWLVFNDCSNGRGYLLKLPFNKNNTISRKSSGINNLDPKYSIADSLVAYTDRGNIYVENMWNGKKSMMTFGEKLDIDYDDLHQFIDSVNVTNNRIWVKVKINNEWKSLERKITLE